MTNSIDHAQKIQKKHGVSYYLATLFFPKKIREATFSLYAFVREVDDIVDTDTALSNEQKIIVITQTEKEFFETLAKKGSSPNPISILFASTVEKFSISKEYISSFFETMRIDCMKDRYSTYGELQEYMYGSATVIGYMMCQIIGYKEGALPYAKKLAEAMQMTNFIRDIKEDYVERNRIYIPAEDLKLFGITDKDFKDQSHSPQFKKLIQFEIARTRRLYTEAWDGISLLSPVGQLPVRLASNLYESILDEIEKHDYDIFLKRHRISSFKRITILIKTILWNQKK